MGNHGGGFVTDDGLDFGDWNFGEGAGGDKSDYDIQ
jgi:hypothetical protein